MWRLESHLLLVGVLVVAGEVVTVIRVAAGVDIVVITAVVDGVQFVIIPQSSQPRSTQVVVEVLVRIIVVHDAFTGAIAQVDELDEAAGDVVKGRGTGGGDGVKGGGGLGGGSAGGSGVKGGGGLGGGSAGGSGVKGGGGLGGGSAGGSGLGDGEVRGIEGNAVK